ncbi:hypothetical protein GS597_07685 [Synechococcales cyanobacterium C]|uniref:Uncharacterized protein n=1 Tax=Petrachloros mirabilis ULC683 TaxID=2781853 RepID=A0A8K1ZWW9_9CYAN|nr:hypothetical protein [Petrachloros mirabilis]NCJ06393.1 hypothetical protein [Petrachloros mirabilis ULC683]
MIWTQFLKPIYRKEPISAFLILVGAVDATLGGVGGHGSLLFLGVATIAGALVIRWQQAQRRQEMQPEPITQRYLPTNSSQSELPMLSISKKQPPQP